MTGAADLRSRALFGPAEDLTCECGTRVDWARFAEVCAACGVERTLRDASFHRTAHVVLATPVMHPYAEPVLTALLRASRDDMSALRRHEAQVAYSYDARWDVRIARGPAPSRGGHEALLEALRDLDPERELDRLAGTGLERVMSVLARGMRESTRPEHLMLLALPVPPIELSWDTPRGRPTRSLVERLYGAVLEANRVVRERHAADDARGFADAAAALQDAVDRVFWALSTTTWLDSWLDRLLRKAE